MRRRSRVLALAAAALVGLLGAAPLQAASSPLLSGCTTLASHGAYVLTRDVTTATSGACLDIEAPNVVLDLGGHTVTGTGRQGVGVFIAPAAANARVVDGTLTGFFIGVADDGSGAVLQRLTAGGNLDGIVVGDVAVSPSVCDGCAASPVSGVVLSDDRAAGNGNTGIVLRDAATTTVASSVASGNGLDGILLDPRSSRDRLVGNTAADNGGAGIALGGGATRNQVVGNRATGNGDTDLADVNAGCDDNQWVGNTFGTSIPSQPSCIH